MNKQCHHRHCWQNNLIDFAGRYHIIGFLQASLRFLPALNINVLVYSAKVKRNSMQSFFLLFSFLFDSRLPRTNGPWPVYGNETVGSIVDFRNHIRKWNWNSTVALLDRVVWFFHFWIFRRIAFVLLLSFGAETGYRKSVYLLVMNSHFVESGIPRVMAKWEMAAFLRNWNGDVSTRNGVRGVLFVCRDAIIRSNLNKCI